jgi:hypothetical protein
MQALGVMSLLAGIICMFLLFLNWTILANYTFVLSLILLISSLSFSIREIMLSINALNLVLKDME